MIVAKRNKRLVVLDGERIVYCPPAFLRPFMREHLQVVADDGCSIASVIAFEERFHPNRHLPKT